MMRLRLASLAVAASLGLVSGCCMPLLDRPLLGRFRGGCPADCCAGPTDCCEGPALSDCGPSAAAPIAPPAVPQLSPAPPPRLVPQPQPQAQAVPYNGQ